VSEANPIRVLIVDDHAVVRGGLSKFLQVHKDLELVGEAENGAEAVRLTRQLQPNVVLMDLKMPEMDGVVATREIRSKHPSVRVIVLTSFAEDNMVQGALQAGATGYLLKNISGAELAAAIRAAHAGRMTLSSEATEVLVHAAAHPIVPADELTEREREVLGLDGGRPEQPGDRQPSLPEPGHREVPHRQHLLQAGRRQSRGRGDPRHPAPSDLSAPIRLDSQLSWLMYRSDCAESRATAPQLAARLYCNGQP
jgi:NarL family two-component system response regulator LiaR